MGTRPPLEQQKNPKVAALLGLVLLGAGHAYCGKWGQALAWLIFGIIGIGICFEFLDGLLGLLAALGLLAFSIVDAAQTAEKVNRARAGA